MGWGDEQAPECHINRAFVSELHKTIVANLTPRRVGEGDHAPGEYRSSPLEINGSEHVPPPNYLIDDLMEELFAFMGNDLPAQYYLLKVAIAHHRLMWIHPFGNGNGRTGRLFTYAILVKTGFRVHVGQILNPTAVFCIDRDRYNALLSKADEGTDEAIVEWCFYVLDGLNAEIRKIERLADRDYVRSRLLLPALAYAQQMKYIDDEEHAMLKVVAQKTTVQASDMKQVLKGLHPVTVSRKIKGLRDKKMLQPETEGGNKYHLSFINNFLVRGMIQALEVEGYIPLQE